MSQLRSNILSGTNIVVLKNISFFYLARFSGIYLLGRYANVHTHIRTFECLLTRHF